MARIAKQFLERRSHSPTKFLFQRERESESKEDDDDGRSLVCCVKAFPSLREGEEGEESLFVHGSHK